MSTPRRLVGPTGTVHADSGRTARGLARTACGRLAEAGWGTRLVRPAPAVGCVTCLAAGGRR